MLLSMGWEGESLKKKNRVIKGKIQKLCRAQVTKSQTWEVVQGSPGLQGVPVQSFKWPLSNKPSPLNHSIHHVLEENHCVQPPRAVATQGDLCFYVFLGSWILHHPLSFLWHVPCLSSFHPHLKYGNLTLEKESLGASDNHSQGFHESTKGGCSWLFQIHKLTSNTVLP